MQGCAVTVLEMGQLHLGSTGQPHSAAQHSTAQHSTAQRSTAQHSAAQRSTAQHSKLQEVWWIAMQQYAPRQQ